MSQKVFLDSGIFIAFLNRRDEWHDQAVHLFQGPKPAWYTSLLVVSETYSWFLHRMGEEAARSFLSLLRHLPGLKLLEASRAQHEAVLKKLGEFRGTKLTYVDASSLCFLERRGIRRVWANDRHLGISGVELFPRG